MPRSFVYTLVYAPEWNGIRGHFSLLFVEKFDLTIIFEP